MRQCGKSHLLCAKTSFFSFTSAALVDLEDAEDVGRGQGVTHRVEPEGRARDGLELGALLQPQEARHLARLQEVERVGPCGRGGAVALHALQLLRPRSAGHHIQLNVLRLLLVEQHLRRTRRELTCREPGSPQWNRTDSGFPLRCYRNAFSLWLDFLQTSVGLTGPKSGYIRLAETRSPSHQHMINTSAA